MIKEHFILASSSPRRQELLKHLQVPFDQYSPDVNEYIDQNVSPEDAIMKVAKDKALAASEKFPNSLVLAADTIVMVDGEYLGKPSSDAEVKAMLKKLSNHEHEVITGCAFVQGKNSKLFYSKATVTFDALDNSDIDSYLQTKEPYNKAGAYAIQGYASKFVREIQGDYYAIMGLPVNKVYRALKCYREGNLFSKCNLM